MIKEAEIKKFRSEKEEVLFVSLQTDGSIKDILQPNPRNRMSERNRPHINRLKKSLREDGYDREDPIIIDSNFVQQTGHHRRQAILELETASERGNYQGFWMKEGSAKDILRRARREDISKKWSTSDWILSYANEGLPEYIRIKEFMERYGFRIKVSIMLMADAGHQPAGNLIDEIRMGNFVGRDWGIAHSKATYLLEVEEIIETKLTVVCTAAILGFFKVDGFKPRRLIQVIKEHKADFMQQRTEENNRVLLERYYNSRLSHDNRIKLALR